MRYAAALVLLGAVAERVLVLHFHLPFLQPSPRTTVAVLIASVMLACFGWNTDKVDAALIDETNQSFSEHARAAVPPPCYEEGEVTIRLEDGQLGSLWKHRCVVTIHDRAGGVQNTGQEAWYAREDG